MIDKNMSVILSNTDKTPNYVMFISNIDTKKFIKNYSTNSKHVCFLSTTGVNVYFNCNNEEWRSCTDPENFPKGGGGLFPAILLREVLI